MREFTPQFILEQKEFVKNISPLPWHACTCGKCGMVSNQTDLVATATRGNWGDDYPDLRRVGGSIEGKFETFMNQITYGNVPPEIGNANAKYIEQACNNYPLALDALLDVTKKLEKAQARVQELEQERRWIPVSERLPEKDEIILVYNKKFGISLTKNWLYTDYWISLPQPPQEEE